jgi:hypothetical protein
MYQLFQPIIHMLIWSSRIFDSGISDYILALTTNLENYLTGSF